MKLKKKVNNAILIITFLLITFIGCINDIKSSVGYLIYGLIITIIVLNTIILYKYGRED